MFFNKLWEKFKKFCAWVWQECKDWHTIVIFIIVIIVMYSPVWGGYLLHWLFDIKAASVVATAYLAFWAGPFTPFFPMCIAITLGIKRFFEKLKSRKDKNNILIESDDNTSGSSVMDNDTENNDKKDYE